MNENELGIIMILLVFFVYGLSVFFSWGCVVIFHKALQRKNASPHDLIPDMGYPSRDDIAIVFFPLINVLWGIFYLIPTLVVLTTLSRTNPKRKKLDAYRFFLIKRR
ncbi:hypothetical protein BH753_gp017 [Bacillus phage Shbh1]|uniref:Uncharacterized protein n=1 Tax=Bacillus phage Shbh1 TaxID=1796992 RepID=A0A142F142_9CAUD|nr:hypothetical protein BH753_gp017 [Bacillus phage Shbh1]AMQ66499.1 hypothetical protein [Bacillus phage Shbh1]